MSTGQMYRLTINVGGVNLGVFDGMSSGGGATAAITKDRPGGMGDEVATLALGSLDDITVTVGNRKSDYWTTKVKWLVNLVLNGGADMSVQRQPLGANKKTFGDATTYTGTLSAAAPGAVDPNDTATEMITLTMSTVGIA